MRRPTRPARNLRDFADKNHWLGRSDQWACLECHGRGWNYIDPPDPVEGYRYCRTLTCGASGGSRKGTKAAVAKAYRAALAIYRKAQDEYRQCVKLRKEALHKLSKEEVRAIRELGN